MTFVDTEAQGFTVGFQFCRALRQPRVREQLAGMGYDADGHDVVTAWLDGETVAEAVARCPLEPPRRRVLLVRPDPAEATGWAMRWGSE